MRTRFVFTGDADHNSEAKIWFSSGIDLNCDVFKCKGIMAQPLPQVGDFLPRLFRNNAVISCGAGNKYGHRMQIPWKAF